jgi:PRTRC genetic system protein A
MRPVGYLVNERGGPVGEPGLFYDYILAGNGVFVRARSPLLEATVLTGLADVRGLAPLEEKVELTWGKIPWLLYNLAVSALAATPDRERYLAVTWEGEYHLRVPPQEGNPGGVQYDRLPNTVLDIHSHGAMSAFFSFTDDRDEQGLRIYMVMGKFNTLFPDMELRVGVYGYFAPLILNQVFG